MLSVYPLNERQFSSSIAESLERRGLRHCPELILLESETCFSGGISSLMAPGADELKFLVDSNPLKTQKYHDFKKIR